jgi:choline-glycine betaine transporter
VESLAALALAWSLFHRISRARIGPPLAPLRSFRLGDEFVWGLLAGIAILVIPNFGQIRGLGLNLSLFFGALYALRGLGVLSWVIAPRALAVAIFIVCALIFWPRVLQASFVLVVGLGLLDNWLDWRRPARQAT